MKYYTILLIFITQSGFAKDEAFKFGKFSEQEIAMKICTLDSAAGAIVLSDIGSIKYELHEYGFGVVFSKKFRIKILDKKALYLADQFLYGVSAGSVDKIKAHTVNFENGKAVESEVEKKDIFFDKLYEDFYTMKIPFRNVKEGSIIEAEFELKSSGYKFPVWYFQREIPTLKSSFKVSIPEYFTFRKKMGGYLQPAKVNEDMETVTINGDFSYVENQTTYMFENIPSLIEEPNVSSIENYLSKVEYELSSVRIPGRTEELLSTNWEEITKLLYKSDNIGVQASIGSNFMNELYDQIKSQTFNSDSERIDAAYKLIQSKIRWNKINSVVSGNGIKEAYKKGEGNSADINLLLLRLLKDLNYNVYPVAISTRKNGFLSYFPTLFDFNHLIVLIKLNGKNLLLDASEKNYPSYLLPEKCINDRGLVVKETGLEWVPLNAQRVHSSVQSVETKIDATGKMTGKLVLQRKEYAASQFRGNANDDNDIEKYLAEFAKINMLTVNSKEINNVAQANLPVLINVAFSNQTSIVNGDEIFVQPMFLSSIKENPYKLKQRIYPVEYTEPVEETYVFNLTLPEGYTVSEKPANINYALPQNGGKFSYQVSINNNTVQLISKFSIKKILFAPEEYDSLKEFYSQIINKQNEQIVLKKL
ncbi:MAG: DUF3857 domain-containing protein [Chitinophagales bacterium]|nr:DUF3857 domain-containing protein [Chitinophagales bacterium]